MKTNEILNNIFTSYWDQPALVCDEQILKYSDLYEYANSIKDWLSSRGCRNGDTVALHLPNGWPFAVAYLACIMGNYRFVPINPELSSDDQQYILRRVSAKIILNDDKLIANMIPGKVVTPDFSFPGDIVSAIFFTSGTTGRPKGVCHTLNSLFGNVIAFNQCMGIDSNTRLYHCLPMAYMAGFLNTLLSPWVAGGTVLLGPRFRPTEALQFWQRPLEWRANTFWITPTLAAVLVRMNRDPDIRHKLSGITNQIFCGTAPLSSSLREDFRAIFGCPLQESYGMSEVLLVSAQTRTTAETQDDAGKLISGVVASFRAVQDQYEKELVIHSPYSLVHYLLETEENSPLLDDGGMPSGDLGRMEGDSLIITGRLKDLLIRGGLNISPLAVENVLLREPGVLEAAVIGLPHKFWGESIVACIVTDPEVDINKLQDSLRIRCNKELGEGMRPDQYVWLKALPRNPAGKVQKHVLKGQLS
jgi:acyl-CoA synthetase (AMP-forming)/AMP-acid ligase II